MSSPLEDISPIEWTEDVEKLIEEKDAQIRHLRSIQARQRVEIDRLRRLATQQVTSLAAAMESGQLREAITAALEAASRENL